MLARHPRGRRDVGERPVTAVAVKPVRRGRERARPAVVPFPGTAEAGDRRRVEVVVEVVADVQIEPAVAVEVGERRRHAPPGVSGARLAGDVGEGPVAVVAEQLVRSEGGAVEVDPTVVVEVARRDAHAVRAPVEPAALGDVREAQGPAAVAMHLEVVPVQAVPRRTGPGRDGVRVERTAWAGRTALYDVDIEIAVVVEVEHRRAGPHGLDDPELSGLAVEMHEVDAGRSGQVDEPGLAGGRCGRLRGGVDADPGDAGPGGEQHREDRPGGCAAAEAPRHRAHATIITRRIEAVGEGTRQTRDRT